MNTKLRYLVGIFCLLLLHHGLYAQSTYELGALPSLNFNKKLQNDWSVNAKLESRQVFQEGELSGMRTQAYDYLLTDMAFVAAKTVGLNSRIGGGYMLRVEEGEIYHRFIQQFIIVQKANGFRLAHRFLSDQTLSEAEQPEFRLRYRLSSEIPLNGESVDPREFYLKINNEYLNSLQAGSYDLEIRLVPLLGYDITEKYKIETGLDYRISSFLSQSTEHSYWWALNFFIEI
ncbi:DUF2490 domain-containing protein [Cytophagales bacterium LB-30]|uniref:DUF2490 domain-containing protein n=1 Tax=Shiella aurantiaca TaxID=3058365 RepID=A0ABT8F8U0_9BACT|nr:DUF2490 domain-containing protein [Shiella aurantiaca]MDN4166698.1 DUF2490 domain-containing protein [Shiella aurantiaca]